MAAEMLPFLYTHMATPIRANVDDIICYVKQRALDVDTFYNHVFEGTLDKYYSAILTELASDLLALPVERAYLDLEPLDAEADVEEVTDAVMELSLVVSSWFLKDAAIVSTDLARVIQKVPAEDIREARFLLRKNLLH